MKKKVITGVSGAVFALLMICLEFTKLSAIFLFLVAFAVLANHEILTAAKVKNKPIMVLSCIVAASFPIMAQFSLYSYIKIPLILVALIYAFILMVFMLAKYTITRFEHVAMALFSSIAIPYAMSTLLYISDMYKVTNFSPYTKANCSFLTLLALLCAWMTDAMAYFTGSKFGKHKMAPLISPKKSWEGAVGGVVGTAIVNVLLWCAYYILAEMGYITKLFIPLWAVVVLSVVLSIVAMLGDLSASAIKRNYGIKDFGTIMGEGQGGVMDRFDSACFVLPAMYGIIQFYELYRLG